MLKAVGIVLAIGAVIITIQESYTFPASEGTGPKVNVHHKRVLTQEESELANNATEQIITVLERNLIRLLAPAIVEEQRLESKRQQRQGAGGNEEDADEEESENATINPNTLPQVAALLGAIFSGNLNLTNVVDRAFFLVPDTVRTQVTGLFKLLGGNGQLDGVGGDTSTLVPVAVTPAYVPHPLDANTYTTEKISNVTEDTVKAEEEQVATTTTKAVDVAVFGSVFESKQSTLGNSEKKKLVSDLEKPGGMPVGETPFGDDVNGRSDDEFKKSQTELIQSGGFNETLPKDKEPRYFINQMRQLFKSDSLNFTAIFRAMPELFKGAREAFVLLETLGEIASGEGDVDDLNLRE